MPGPAEIPLLESVDARTWGTQLRFSAPAKLIESFASEYLSGLPPFLLYGSGDFHHLTALWLRRRNEQLTVVSFDNHPDSEFVRPPSGAAVAG